VVKRRGSKNRNDGCTAHGGAIGVDLGEFAIPVEFDENGIPTDVHFSSNGAWLGGACCASNKVGSDYGACACLK
jgi:hypothetical protein